MSELNERISSVVAMSGNTKTKFAEKINISQPYLSQLCSGAKLPSDRTIADIFRVKHGCARASANRMRSGLARRKWAICSARL